NLVRGFARFRYVRGRDGTNFLAARMLGQNGIELMVSERIVCDRLEAAIASATISIGTAVGHAERALVGRIGLARGATVDWRQRGPEVHAHGILRAGAGLAVELGAVAIRLRDVTQTI